MYLFHTKLTRPDGHYWSACIIIGSESFLDAHKTFETISSAFEMLGYTLTANMARQWFSGEALPYGPEPMWYVHMGIKGWSFPAAYELTDQFRAFLAGK